MVLEIRTSLRPERPDTTPEGEARSKKEGEREEEREPDNPVQSAARGVRSREERKSKQRKNRRDSEAGNRKGQDAKTQRMQGERRAGDERIRRDTEVDLRDQGATRGNEKRRGTDSPEQSAARKPGTW